MTPVPVAEDVSHAAVSVGPFYGTAGEACRYSGHPLVVLTTAKVEQIFPDAGSARTDHSPALASGRAELLPVPGGFAVCYTFWRPIGL